MISVLVSSKELLLACDISEYIISKFLPMIGVQKIHIFDDEKLEEALLDVIAEREVYYKELFSSVTHPPEITVKFERVRPFSVRITFRPWREKPVMLDTDSYSEPVVGLKHAFKKLRRTAKNHYVKNKRSHRS